MKTLPLIATAFAAAFALSACEEHRNMTAAPGEYKEKTSVTDANGTDYKTDKKTRVTVDRYGNKHVETETTNVRDPEGLMNKEKTKTKSEEVYRNY